MIQVSPKCKKCKHQMREPLLSDKTEDNLTQFKIIYCPNCIDLGEEIKSVCFGKTIKHNIKVKEKAPK